MSIAVTVSGSSLSCSRTPPWPYPNPGTPAATANTGLPDTGFLSLTGRENQVLLIITLLLAALVTVNVTVITWATVQNSRHTAAITRALGASARQLTIGLSAAQVSSPPPVPWPGWPGCYGLFAVASRGGSISQPPAWWLIAAVLGTLITVAGLTTISARLSTRPPIARTLQTTSR